MDAPLGDGHSKQLSAGDVSERPRVDVCQQHEKRCKGKTVGTYLGALTLLGLLVYYFMSTSGFQIPPKPPLPNAENRSVYFGYGCFWHAQYDFYEIEHDVFDRSPSQVTSLVGYAGGLYTSEDGLVCYHGGPAGSEYGDDGHAEVVQVELDAGQEEAQYTQLLSKFFNDGFICDGSDCSRKDPGDRGAAYRNVLGLPGGKAGKLWHLVNPQNVHAMELRDGGDNGGRGDEEDEGLVYVYDSLQYHFYRGEQYHQFHANTVLGRACPSSYLVSLKNTQKALHRIDPTGCPEGGMGF